MPVSKAGIGLVVFLLNEVFVALGWTIDFGVIEAGMNGLVALVALVVIVWGQVDRKDLEFGLLRK